MNTIENEVGIVRVNIKDGTFRDVKEGTTLLEFSKEFEKEFKSVIVSARVNNDIKELNFTITDNCNVEFIDLTREDGMRFYRRSLTFVIIKAVNDIFPDRKVVINNSISKGLYFEVRGGTDLNNDEVLSIEKRMIEIVESDIPFEKKLLTLEEAQQIFKSNGRADRYKAIKYRNKPYVTIYNCGGFEDYFYGYMVPSTGYLKNFKLIFNKPGIIMLFPEKSNPNELPVFAEQKKLFNVFAEHKKWGRILGVNNVGDLNDIIKKGNIGDFIRIAEALQEKKIAHIADMIAQSDNKKRLVLISGPSSSGKTTFAHRLSIQLRVNGLKPVTVSLDDYFLDREDTPKDEDGNYDFEALEAIDIKLFNNQLADLVAGKEVEVPTFNFSKGLRETFGRKLQIGNDQVLIIEGIHGLNEKLTSSISKESKFKIYVSALASLNIDDHNRIPTTDTRFIRRIVRDYQFRGSTALNSIKIWPSVRRGEEKNIFPFQEEADVMFNSAMIYELSALRKQAEPIIMEVTNNYPEYSEAKRLLEFLRNFLAIDSKDIPNNSIIREFIGGNCFYS